MDSRTVALYDTQAATFAAAHRAVEPHTVYRLVGEHFRAGAPTADIGCGSGRDSAWLVAHGFPTVGYDASTGMLEQARASYPQLELHQAELPALEAIPDCRFVNVLCNAVLMHLPRSEHAAALRALARIMLPDGNIVISFRPSRFDEDREPDGRLFAMLDVDGLAATLATAGLELLRLEYGADHRPDVRWYAAAARKAR